MITAIIISLVVGFIAGALVFRKHAAKATELEAKGKSILDVLKGR
jgi:F0F1-type ATP synthase assembly protein I